MAKVTDCHKTKAMLADYAEGNLGWLAVRGIRAHLSGCDACLSELRALDATTRLVADLGEREPPVGLWNGVYNRITSPESSRDQMAVAPRPWLASLRVRAIVTGLIIALTIGGFAISQFLTPRRSTGPDTITAEYIEEHSMRARGELFADRFTLTSIAAIAETERQEHGKL
ncbi:MAG: zf-HC2 domain-containing protein [Armatimonadota bacterium]|nr:zf-HC2 domain-containing protein [Armatimonadota bacterium]